MAIHFKMLFKNPDPSATPTPSIAIKIIAKGSKVQTLLSCCQKYNVILQHLKGANTYLLHLNLSCFIDKVVVNRKSKMCCNFTNNYCQQCKHNKNCNRMRNVFLHFFIKEIYSRFISVVSFTLPPLILNNLFSFF